MSNGNLCSIKLNKPSKYKLLSYTSNGNLCSIKLNCNSDNKYGVTTCQLRVRLRGIRTIHQYIHIYM